MAKSVVIGQQATQLEDDTSGMLTKMAKRLYVRRFSKNDTESESTRQRKPGMKHRR